MNIKKLQNDIYLLKVLQAKKYDVNDIVKMSNDEINDLSLPLQIKNMIIEYIEDGSKSENELTKTIQKEKFIDEINEEVIEFIKQDVINLPTFNNTDEQVIIPTLLNPIIINDVDGVDDAVENDIEITHEFVSTEVVDKVKELLQQKVYKTALPYINYIRKNIDKETLDTLDGILVNKLISERLAELKDEQ